MNLKNTSLHLSSPRVLLFPNMSFPAELCFFCRNVLLWKSHSWGQLEQLHLLWKHPQGRAGWAKGTRLGLPCQGGLGVFQHVGTVTALPSKSIHKIHCIVSRYFPTMCPEELQRNDLYWAVSVLCINYFTEELDMLSVPCSSAFTISSFCDVYHMPVEQLTLRFFNRLDKNPKYIRCFLLPQLVSHQ